MNTVPYPTLQEIRQRNHWLSFIIGGGVDFGKAEARSLMLATRVGHSSVVIHK